MNHETIRIACADCNMRELCMPLGLSSDELDRIDQVIGARRKIKRGETVFHNGEKFTNLYAIRTGFFKTCINTEDGRNQVTGFQMAGEIIGLDGIVKDGQVTRGWIGVEPQDLNPELAQTFNIKPDAVKNGGVIITGVLQNGPAAQAGVQPGDVITAVKGKAIGNVSQLLTAVAALKPGSPAPLTVIRAGSQSEIPVTPGQRQRPKAQQQPQQ